MILRNEVTDIFVGEMTVSTVYLGSNMVWERGTIIPSNEIWYTNGSTNEPTIPVWGTTFGANIVSNTYNIEKSCWIILFDNSVTYIGGKEFEATNIITIILPNTVTRIDTLAFNKCKNLTSITIPNNVSVMGQFAFSDCIALTSFVIPTNVTNIAKNVLKGCTSLTSLVIPTNIKTIQGSFLADCANLEKIFFRSSTPPKINDADEFISYGQSKDLKIYVPTGAKEAYDTAFNGYYTDIIVEYS